jgi:nucleotide-binding universal stress UspA family protein
MTAPDVPRNVLLATDLSARCDRALDRAVAVAAESGAQLTILHVFEEFEESRLAYGRHPAPSWRAPPDAAAIARRRILQGLRADVGDAVAKATVLIEDGEPAEVIERVADSQRADLIVTGIASERPFASRPVVLGKTVERLLRRVSIPMLIVRNRVRAAYEHILVATDLSEPSARALQAALRFFPTQPLHLLHAFEPAYSGLIGDSQRHVESFREAHAAELAAFLDAMVLPEAARRRLVPMVEPGRPAQLVHEYVRDRGADLVVLGTHGRSAVLEALLGSTAKSILSSLQCDALLMPCARASADAAARSRGPG